MYSDEHLLGRAVEDLTTELADFAPPVLVQMPCDRWLARSVLHKACRRGDVEMAWRALATLLREAPNSIWRALMIIIMEDIGVCATEVFAKVFVAGRDRRWRQTVGGDWKVAAFLVMQMCRAEHDQAVCDLYEHAICDPSLDQVRDFALDAPLDELARRLRGSSGFLMEDGVLALAIGGGLAEGQRLRDPAALFDMLAEKGACWEVIDLCRAAWRVTRIELALLFPLIWDRWTKLAHHVTVDDPLPPVTLIGELPEYAVDQFTRSGIEVSRKLLRADPKLRAMLENASIPRATWHRTVGDLIFLVEGSPLSRRVIWPIGEELRQPYRCLPDTVGLGPALPEAIQQITAQRALITDLRAAILSHFPSAKTAPRLL